MRIIQYIILILLVVVATLFAAGNPGRIELRFFPFDYVLSIRAFILVPALLLIGFGFGRIFSLIPLWSLKLRYKNSQTKLQKISDELSEIKKNPPPAL